MFNAPLGVLFRVKVAGMMAASSLAEVSATALREMLGNEQGSGGVLDVWLVLSRHKVHTPSIAFDINSWRAEMAK